MLRALVVLLVSLPAAAKVNVAVMYFDNHSNLREYDVLSKGMADMLITDLSASEELQLVEREKLEAVISELNLQRTKYFDPDTAVKVGKLLGAQYTVTGAFTGFEPDVRIDVRMIEVKTSRVVVTAQVKGKKDAFFELEQELVKKFLTGLSQKMAAPQTGPLGLEAAVKYGQSLDTADKGDMKAASTQLAAVVRAAPGFTLGKARYSEFLQKLKSAGVKHDVALGGEEKALLDELAVGLAKPFAKKSSDAFFCFRGVKAAYLMWKIDQLSGKERGTMKYRIASKAELPQVKKLLAELFEHEVGTIELGLKNLDVMKNENFTKTCGMAFHYDNKDNKIYTRLGTLRVPWFDHYDAHPMDRATKLATWVATGTFKRAHFDDDEDKIPSFQVLPVMPMVSAASVRKTLDLLDVTQKAAEKVPAFMMGEATLELEFARANVLLNAGKREDGIAVLQSWLDRNPKSKAYKAVEGVVEGLLGISENAKNDTEALASCKASDEVLHREIDRVIDAEGPGGVATRLSAIESKCAPLAKQVRAQATWGLLMRADCANAKKYAAEDEERSAVSTLCEP